MKIEEAIATLTDLKAWGGFGNYSTDETEALDMAISALRAQQEAEKNEPLTIPELLKMDSQPVWVVGNGGSGEWRLVDAENKLLYGLCGDDEIIYCGTDYTAYRHPKEAHND